MADDRAVRSRETSQSEEVSLLPVARPLIGDDERAQVLSALESGWIATGPRVEAFERGLAEAVGARYAVCVSSCSAALHVAISQFGLRSGDEVVTTPITYCSTVNAILHAGAKPVLADVEPGTLNLDPARVAEAITPRTRAILPVHYGGHPCAMDPLLELAGASGAALVEDAAHALGAVYRGRLIGTLGAATCFSFHATKNITSATGGAIVTEDKQLASRARLLAYQGIDRSTWVRRGSRRSWDYAVVALGFNYAMNDVQAALGHVQLGRLAAFVERRQEIARIYDEAFAAESAVEPLTVEPDVKSARHLYPVKLQLEHLRVDRSRFVDELAARGIETTVNFIPIHYHPYYTAALGVTRGALPVAEAAFESLVSLPLYPAMSDKQVLDVVAAVRGVLHDHACRPRAVATPR